MDQPITPEVRYHPDHYADGRAAISVQLGDTREFWPAETWRAVATRILSVGQEPAQLPEQPWPVSSGPGGVNPWNRDVAAFAKLVQDNPGFWPADFSLKYLGIRVDTRSGHFVLTDDLGETISPDKVVRAIRHWKTPSSRRRKAPEGE